MANNFIEAYYEKIWSGKITAGKWIKLWYQYVISGLSEGRFFYDDAKAQKAIRYIETFCRHHEGALAPQLIVLELWQKAFLSVVFGIVDANGFRQFTEIVLIIGRKNGKTLFAAAIASYCTFADGEYGARIYFTAPKLEQAALCYEAYYQMISKDEELDALAKRRRTDIYVEENNASAKPLAFSAKKSDGLNTSLGVADEFASWEGDAGLKFYEVLKSSMGARRQPMLLAISTAGYVNEGVYDELLKRCTRMILGSAGEKKLAPFLYMIDDIEKWKDIEELKKANPNMGVSVTKEYFEAEIAIAENSLSKRAEFIVKYCNLKQNSAQAWLPAEAIEASGTEPLSLSDFKNSYCVGGIDLSQTTDLTACTAVIEKNGRFYVFAHFFLPAQKLEYATARDALPYQAYVERGLLTLSGENFVDYKDCFAWFRRLVEEYQIYPLKVGYDRYSAQYLVQDMAQYGFHMDDVYQGTNLTPVIQEVEGLIRDKVFDFGDNDLLKIHLLNMAVKKDGNAGRCRVVKIKPSDHIDGGAALLDAMCVRQKYYAEIGHQLKNVG